MPFNDDNIFVKEAWANCAGHIDFDTCNELTAQQAGELADYLETLQAQEKIRCVD